MPTMVKKKVEANMEEPWGQGVDMEPPWVLDELGFHVSITVDII